MWNYNNIGKEDVSIFIVTKTRDVIYVDEYDSDYDEDGRFVMITNDVLDDENGDDNTIYISRRWLEQTDMVEWELDEMYIKTPEYTIDPESLYSGYRLTMDTLTCARPYLIQHNKECEDNVKSVYDFLPAIGSVVKVNETLDGVNLRGYLPSIGQLVYISHNIKIINSVMQLINGKQFEVYYNQLKGDWWVMNQCGMEFGMEFSSYCYCHRGEYDNSILTELKLYNCFNTLPLFYKVV